MDEQVKKFQLEANIRFRATDIDDAFTKLAQHFQALADGAETEPFFSGEFQLWAEDQPLNIDIDGNPLEVKE